MTVENPVGVTESCFECGARVTACGCNACVPSTIASDLASSPKKKKTSVWLVAIFPSHFSAMEKLSKLWWSSQNAGKTRSPITFMTIWQLRHWGRQKRRRELGKCQVLASRKCIDQSHNKSMDALKVVVRIYLTWFEWYLQTNVDIRLEKFKSRQW